MASIKQVGEGVIEEIIKERNANGDFTSIYDYVKRMDIKCSNKKTLEGLIKSGAFASIEKSRKQLIDNIEYITATASKEAKAKESGQGSLFDLLGDTSAIEDAKFQLSGSDEEYDARTLQNLEKEFLGFYVTSHPLSTIRDKLPFLMTHKISEIHDLPNEKLVTICGLVTATKQIPTKKDPTKFIRFVTIEDLSGKIDVIAFNHKIQEYGNYLQNEQRVIVSGKVSKRSEDEPPSLIVESVKTVDNSNIFTLTLLDDFDFRELHALKNLLCQYNGSDPVMFKVKDIAGDEVKILAASIFWVESSNTLVNNLKKSFGTKIEVDVSSMDTVEEPATV